MAFRPRRVRRSGLGASPKHQPRQSHHTSLCWSGGSPWVKPGLDGQAVGLEGSGFASYRPVHVQHLGGTSGAGGTSLGRR